MTALSASQLCAILSQTGVKSENMLCIYLSIIYMDKNIIAFCLANGPANIVKKCIELILNGSQFPWMLGTGHVLINWAVGSVKDSRSRTLDLS